MCAGVNLQTLRQCDSTYLFAITNSVTITVKLIVALLRSAGLRLVSGDAGTNLGQNIALADVSEGI